MQVKYLSHYTEIKISEHFSNLTSMRFGGKKVILIIDRENPKKYGWKKFKFPKNALEFPENRAYVPIPRHQD